MGEIHFKADRLLSWDLGIECSRKKHIIPAHRPGVPEFYPPLRLIMKLGSHRLSGKEEVSEREDHQDVSFSVRRKGR